MNRSLGCYSARAAAAGFVAFCAFQLALAAGAPLGALAWGGANGVLPGRMRAASAAAAVYLLLAAAGLLVRSGDWGRRFPRLPFTVLTWVLAIQMGLNTLANFVSRSDNERLIMAPATTILCLLCLCAAIDPNRRA